jgi:hypothetical protein
MRVVIDEYRQGDLCELITDEGQGLGQPDGTELADTEDLAVRGLAVQRSSMSSTHARSPLVQPPIAVAWFQGIISRCVVKA